MSWIKCWAVVLAIATLPGCAVGYNSTLFYTQSNIGIDAETKPPTAEISIARREGVIEPGFEGGQTPTVVASFRSNADPLSRFFFGVQSTFAGGDAAAALSAAQGGPEFTGSSAICLSQKPSPKLFGLATIPEKGDVMPFAFGTDTVFGLKVSWSGTTAQFPDSLRLGFNRKELALAPVFGTDATPNCTIPGSKQTGSYMVQMPAFLAAIDVQGEAAKALDVNVKWTQYFATGTSATTLGNNNEVRKIMLQQAFPPARDAVGVDNPSPLGDKIASFWMPDGTTVDQSHQAKLLNCIQQDNYQHTIPYLIAVGPETDRTKIASCAGVPQ
jgi:hypothetical protein